MNNNYLHERTIIKQNNIAGGKYQQPILQKISDTIKSLFVGTKKNISDQILISSLKKDGLFWLIRDKLIRKGFTLDPYTEQGQYIMDLCFRTTLCLQQTSKIFSNQSKLLELNSIQKLQLCNYLMEYCDYTLLGLLDTEIMLGDYEYDDILLNLIDKVTMKIMQKILNGEELDAYYVTSNQACEDQFLYFNQSFGSDNLLTVFPGGKGLIKKGEYFKNTPLLIEKLSDYYIGLSHHQSAEYRQYVVEFFGSLIHRNAIWSFEMIDKISNYFTNPDSYSAYCHFKQIQTENLKPNQDEFITVTQENKIFKPNPEALKSLDYMLRNVGDGIAQILNTLPLGQITSKKIFDLFFDQGNKKRLIKNQYADALKHWFGARWNDENKMYALIHYSVSKLSENQSGKFAVIGLNTVDFVESYWDKKYNAGLVGIQLTKKKRENGVVSLLGKSAYYPFKTIYYGDKSLIKKA